MKCENCYFLLDDNCNFCPKCGTKVTQLITCTCGHPSTDNYSFCPICGKPLASASVPRSTLSFANTPLMPDKSATVYTIRNTMKAFRNLPGTQSNYRFYNNYAICLPNEMQVGFLDMHTEEYKDSKGYYYNLYLRDIQGHFTFLGIGSRGGIEDLCVCNDVAYWDDFGTLYICHIRTGQSFSKRRGDEHYEDYMSGYKNLIERAPKQIKS